MTQNPKRSYVVMICPFCPHIKFETVGLLIDHTVKVHKR